MFAAIVVRIMANTEGLERWGDWSGAPRTGCIAEQTVQRLIGLHVAFGLSGPGRKGIKQTGMRWIARRRRTGWSTDAL